MEMLFKFMTQYDWFRLVVSEKRPMPARCCPCCHRLSTTTQHYFGYANTEAGFNSNCLQVLSSSISFLGWCTQPPVRHVSKKSTWRAESTESRGNETLNLEVNKTNMGHKELQIRAQFFFPRRLRRRVFALSPCRVWCRTTKRWPSQERIEPQWNQIPPKSSTADIDASDVGKLGGSWSCWSAERSVVFIDDVMIIWYNLAAAYRQAMIYQHLIYQLWLYNNIHQIRLWYAMIVSEVIDTTFDKSIWWFPKTGGTPKSSMIGISMTSTNHFLGFSDDYGKLHLNELGQLGAIDDSHGIRLAPLGRVPTYGWSDAMTSWRHGGIPKGMVYVMEKNPMQMDTAWWWLVAMNLAFSQKYWVDVIIPIDDSSYFSEGWPNHQPGYFGAPPL